MVEPSARPENCGGSRHRRQKISLQKQRDSTERDGMVASRRRQTSDGSDHRQELENPASLRYSVLRNRLPKELHPSFVLFLRSGRWVVSRRRGLIHGTRWVTHDGLLPLSKRGQFGGREELVFHRSPG